MKLKELPDPLRYLHLSNLTQPDMAGAMPCCRDLTGIAYEARNSSRMAYARFKTIETDTKTGMKFWKVVQGLRN